MVSLPIWCACGNLVTFSNETRCEECYAGDQHRLTGKPTRVNTPHLSQREELANERRAAEISRLFQKE